MKTTKATNGAILKEVLTLDEAARFLRMTKRELRTLAKAGSVPGRQIGDDFRFLKDALCEWLRGKDSQQEAFLRLAGAFAGDESLAEIRRAAYEARGRPEEETGD